MEWLLLLVIFPTAVFAECKAPKLENVSVLSPNVSWRGSFEPSCLRGFEVCWTSPYSREESCEMASANTTSMIISGFKPCVTLTVQVTAIAKGNLTSDMLYGSGDSGPPVVTGLKAVQRSRDVMTLEWSSLSNYSCVENVRLWVCENKTQDKSTCIFAKLNNNINMFDVYELQVCRYYYAFLCTREDWEKPAMTTLQFYPDSANELTSVEATNVTVDSAVVKWWISDVNFTCKTEKMRICYQEKSNETSPECWSWVMGQTGSSDSLALTDLYTCTTYSAVVSLRTAGRYSHRTVTFTTPMHDDAIDASIANVSNTEALVGWSFDADKTDCRPDSMQVCYTVVGDDASRMCRSLGTGSHSGVRLRNLIACTAYNVSLTLLTTAEPKPAKALRLATLSKGHPVLEHMNLTAANTSVRVEWTPVNTSLQCVRFYNVSWYSSGDPRRSWQTVSSGSTSFTIFATSRGQTYHVQVAAVFVDNTTESISQHVDVPARSGSSTSFKHLSSTSLLIFVVFSFIRGR